MVLCRSQAKAGKGFEHCVYVVQMQRRWMFSGGGCHGGRKVGIEPVGGSVRRASNKGTRTRTLLIEETKGCGGTSKESSSNNDIYTEAMLAKTDRLSGGGTGRSRISKHNRAIAVAGELWTEEPK